MRQEILNLFKQNDPILYKQMLLFKDQLVINKENPEKYFYRLSRAIAFQQLHGKAATTIWNRFECLFEKNIPTEEEVINMPHEKMRECGFSNSKVSYIKNIAQAFLDDSNYQKLDHLSDNEIIELLTKIKGVGRWTAEIFLMFTIGREDVFSTGDLGLKKGLIKVYNLRKEPTKKQMEKMTRSWIPYRTYASMTLWKIQDTVL